MPVVSCISRLLVPLWRRYITALGRGSQSGIRGVAFRQPNVAGTPAREQGAAYAYAPYAPVEGMASIV